MGDYILSPKMCVERKALPDLEQSLANGRLHTQCEAMSAHYEICILLIEFEEGKFGIRVSRLLSLSPVTLTLTIRQRRTRAASLLDGDPQKTTDGRTRSTCNRSLFCSPCTSPDCGLSGHRHHTSR